MANCNHNLSKEAVAWKSTENKQTSFNWIQLFLSQKINQSFSKRNKSWVFSSNAQQLIQSPEFAPKVSGERFTTQGAFEEHMCFESFRRDTTEGVHKPLEAVHLMFFGLIWCWLCGQWWWKWPWKVVTDWESKHLVMMTSMATMTETVNSWTNKISSDAWLWLSSLFGTNKHQPFSHVHHPKQLSDFMQIADELLHYKQLHDHWVRNWYGKKV